MTGNALLDIKGLGAGYGRVPILHGVDFHVGEGEIVGVLGHNGMGKTTLLKTIMGLIPATARNNPVRRGRYFTGTGP